VHADRAFFVQRVAGAIRQAWNISGLWRRRVAAGPCRAGVEPARSRFNPFFEDREGNV